MTATASVSIDRRRTRGPIQPAVYGQFIEHIGRVIYGGVYEPGSPLSDSEGIRLDVLEACRELRPAVLRWPGGNFASGYHWRDGVGPRDERPVRHDLAWNAIEPNTFGTEEFLDLCRRLGARPYINLNASTGTFDEAQSWVEYCNSDESLPEVLLRRSGPHPAPHQVSIWGLGNENYGWWQHGHTDAGTYAEVAREWGKLLHWTAPGLELIGVGAPDPTWNWTVLSNAAQSIDYLSLHCYWHGGGDDRYASMLAGPINSERMIEGAWGMALEAQRKFQSRRPIRLCIDEWGVWETTFGPLGGAFSNFDDIMRNGISARSNVDTRFEESYDLKDALTVATWFHVLWRHPEKVAIATMAQMVNAIAPLLAYPDGIVRQTCFHPVTVAVVHALPVSLDVLVETDDGDGSLPVLDAAGTTDPATGSVHLSLVNRSRDRELRVKLEGVGGDATQVRIHDDDPFARNTREDPERVVPVVESVTVNGEVVLRPNSHTTLVWGASA